MKTTSNQFENENEDKNDLTTPPTPKDVLNRFILIVLLIAFLCFITFVLFGAESASEHNQTDEDTAETINSTEQDAPTGVKRVAQGFN